MHTILRVKTKLTGHVREAGYEALFFLSGIVGTALEPTSRDMEDLSLCHFDPRLEAGKLKRLEERGMIEGVEEETGCVPRLTALGRAVFEGGREVEAAWSRNWDGQWRVLMFDLPRQSGSSRVKFWRWLQANHFGKLQGSVWISPDPFPAIEEELADSGFDPEMVVLFAGDVVGRQRPEEIVTSSWDFDAINRAYREYNDFAERVLRQCARKIPPVAGFKDILREDRKRWWAAVRPDPLLPMVLLPKTYEGPGSWKIRRNLLQKFGKSLRDGVPTT